MLQSLLAISLVLLLLSLFKIKSLNQEINSLTKELNSGEKELSSLSQHNAKLQAVKTEKQDQVLKLFANQSKVSNRDVVKALGVSSVTAFRYLDELEKAGKIVQNGRFGKTVYYSKIS